MATKAPLRSLQAIAARPSLCSASAPLSSLAARVAPAQAQKLFSTSVARAEELSERPRWSYTPEKMKAPFQPRVKNPQMAFSVNEDPALLDAVYTKFLGVGGENALTDEVKWLAVTHKSFDQGRRGFNDKLAFLGKRILVLQGTTVLLTSQAPPPASTDAYNREPFNHPSLEGLAKVQAVDLGDVLSKQRVGQLARSYGIDQVTRWKPRNPLRLGASGVDVVLTTSVYAIIGALALQKGGEYAGQVAREKVLKPLGLL
ncbi:hypothetical protein VE01_09009 [Pseudogymnoascus verrucosus]|uniref:RNase III domain-containing protein n=1 Tax=Pseudogymnoascus verrucosus TaxID=342668 RepID=A0A1B8GB41_9PEZI|nr:uncharacterized protein VE01_09009 [Pseudogymnoascus verrucosus]OBT93048.1 hypothetical protein VE01_09009 [Pseudogymnoascus verrucosus]